MTNPIVYYCDGQYAQVAQAQSDWIQVEVWDGSSWVLVNPDSKYRAVHPPQEFPCWSDEAIAQNGFPEGITSNIVICGEQEQG